MSARRSGRPPSQSPLHRGGGEVRLPSPPPGAAAGLRYREHSLGVTTEHRSVSTAESSSPAAKGSGAFFTDSMQGSECDLRILLYSRPASSMSEMKVFYWTNCLVSYPSVSVRERPVTCSEAAAP